MGKFFNSVTGQMEDDGKGGMDFSNMFAMPTGIPEQPGLTTPAPSTQKQVDPVVAQYLQQKMQSTAPSLQPPPPMVEDQFSPDKYKQALAKSQSEQDNTSLAQMASGIGAALAGRDPGSVDNYYKDLRGQIQDRTIGEFNRQKAAQSSDPNSAKSVAFRKLVESTMPNIAKAYGPKWNMVTEEDGKNILNFGSMRENIDARKQQAQILMGQKEDAKAEKRSDRELQLAVPGYERTGEVLPKPEEAQKLRKATASAEQLQSKLKRLRELVGGVNGKGGAGAFEYGGKEGQEMETLATEIQLLSKGEDMYQLGVLTGPDMSLLQKITADPSSVNSFFTREGTRLKQIDTQIKSIQDKLGSVTKASGYKPKAGNTPKPTSGPEVGMVEDGHRFKGGDPADPNNWEKM